MLQLHWSILEKDQRPFSQIKSIFIGQSLSEWPGSYYDYQLSEAQGKFGYEVLALKLWCCHGQLTSFRLITISTAVGRLSH